MSKSAADYEKELLDNILEKTGNTLNDWMKLIPSSGEEKVTKITKWLKTHHELNHMQANIIATVYLNDGKPVHSDFDALFSSLWQGKEKVKPIYDKLLKSISNNLSDFKITPRKTYIQLDDKMGKKRCFATFKLNKSNIRLGLDLGDDHPMGGYVEKAKSLGAMPRFSHMIEFKTENDVDTKMIEFIKKSRKRSA